MTAYIEGLFKIREATILTPKRHEHGEDHGGPVVKHVGHPCKRARVPELPEGTILVARRAHQGVAHAIRVTNLVTETSLVSLNLDSGCGTVRRAVASNTRDPRFESSHQQFYLLSTLLKLN